MLKIVFSNNRITVSDNYTTIAAIEAQERTGTPEMLNALSVALDYLAKTEDRKAAVKVGGGSSEFVHAAAAAPHP